MISQKLKHLLERYEHPKNETEREILSLLRTVAASQTAATHPTCDLFCDVISLLQQTPTPSRSPFERGDDLLAAFYNGMRREGTAEYAEALLLRGKLSAEEKREKIDATMLDYTARLITFANLYLYEIFPNASGYDPIVFLYEHLEYAAAKFSVKGEDGKISKQRMNTRSALRKFNEFKCLTEKQLRR